MADQLQSHAFVYFCSYIPACVTIEGVTTHTSMIFSPVPAGLPTIKLTVTHRMSSDIFASIVEMGTPGKKKGRKKGKKKVSCIKTYGTCRYTFKHSILSSRRGDKVL